MEDTLKTTIVGTGSFWVTLWNILPDIVSLAIGIMTIVYLCVKIRKELNGEKKGKAT